MLSQVVILVGGRGTRLGTITDATPKPLLPVGGKPFLTYLIEHFVRHGLRDVVLLAGYRGDMIAAHYAAHPVARADISVLIETEPLGTAGCLVAAEECLDEVFLLANGDSFFDFNALALLDGTGEGDWLAKLALRRVPDPGRYGQVRVDTEGRIVEFAEKRPDQQGNGLINAGVYLLRKSLIGQLAARPLSMEREVFPDLVGRGLLRGQEFPGYFIDIGIPETYEQVQATLPAQVRRPAAFFDRDGTLNRDRGYTHRPDDLEFMPGAVEALRMCNDRNYLTIVVTNQAGIARGLYTTDDVQAFHRRFQEQLQPYGAHIDAFYHCPHHPEGSIPDLAKACRCRKPGVGMFEDACADWDIDLSRSFMVGDKPSDMGAAQAFGIVGAFFSGEPLDELVLGYIGDI